MYERTLAGGRFHGAVAALNAAADQRSDRWSGWAAGAFRAATLSGLLGLPAAFVGGLLPMPWSLRWAGLWLGAALFVLCACCLIGEGRAGRRTTPAARLLIRDWRNCPAAYLSCLEFADVGLHCTVAAALGSTDAAITAGALVAGGFTGTVDELIACSRVVLEPQS